MARARKASLSPGILIADSYRLGTLLGAGGMGEVYDAEHVQSAVPVAIKLLREEASDTIMERFEREGRALSQLHGAHVLKVFDVGVLANGRPYIVMERLHGSDLAVVIKQRGQLSVSRAVTYLLETCLGLAEAHGLGIVHRDLKPANLFRCEPDEGPSFVKILDFGISKVNAAAKAGKTGLTAAGDVFGSPKYMSPEQLRATRDVDVRTDIWSLGVTLAELVTGKTPFEAADFGTLLYNIMEAKPPSVAHVDATHGAALNAVIRKCLAAEPDARFQTIDALADALAPLVDDGAALAQRVRTELSAAKLRATEVQARARPQVTRVLDVQNQTQTAAIMRMAIAPIAPTIDLTRAALPSPAREPVAPSKGRSIPVALGAVAFVTLGALGAFFLLRTSAETTTEKDTSSERSDDSPKPKKRKKKRAAPKASQPDAPPTEPDVLPPALAARPPFRIAPDIGKLLAKRHGTPVRVRELLFFSDRAALTVEGEQGLVRYDYRDGKLGEPRTVKARSGARRDERILLRDLDLQHISKMADEAAAEFGEGKLHAIGLQWLKDDNHWTASSKDGKQKRFSLDGRAL